LGYQDEALNSLRSFLNDYPNSQYITEAKDLLIDVLANTNNYKDALALLQGMGKMTDNAKRVYPRILFGRATELINDGQLSEADALLTTAIFSEYNSAVLPLTYFWKGEIGYRTNQLDTAIKYYQAYATAGSPPAGEANATNVRYNLGYAYLRKENYPVSLSYFQPLMQSPALNSDAFSQDVYVRTADNYLMMKNFAQAKSMYDNVIRLSWPAEDYATFQLAMLGGVRSSAEKISLMNTMIRKFPNSPLVTDANMEIANTYMSDEKFREAIPYLSAVINSDRSENMKPQAYLKMGIAYFNINQNEDALKQFRTLVDKYPNSPEIEDALDNVRAIYVEEGRPGEYADFMRKAGRPISVSSEDSLTYYAAEKKYDDQKLNEALAAFDEYLQKFPNGNYALDAQFNKAEIYYARKDWNNALAAYQAVAADAPNKYAERAALAAARISFFELKDYVKAEMYYSQLKQLAAGQENKLEAMRGLLRSQYQLQKWKEALENAKELTAAKGASADDKALANMAIAKSYQVSGQHDLAIASFRQVVQVNKGALAAEARYEIASSLFQLDKLTDAEKAAFETINKSGSYDYWVTKSYILLGDIYFRQKDYFNAKATFQSVVDNTLNAELKTEATAKLNQVIDEESKSSKVNN
jgi:TolA-binding protein